MTTNDKCGAPSLLAGAMILLGLAGGTTALAQADGEALYQTCVACHGAAGEGNPALGAPALAGQLPSYIERQLRHFRDGIRGAEPGDTYGAQMQPFATQLGGDDGIAAVAEYISSFPAAASPDKYDGDARRGSSLYNGNCGACHGGQGEGNVVLNSPRIAGLDAAYLKRQIANYKARIRGAHPDDRSGRQMAMMAGTLPDDAALDDVIAYLMTLESAQ